jgi:hypothetical protein
MPRMIDQIRASRLPSNMMQFAARGALQVPPAENIEILVHLARHNRIFGELARMTLAGWDEKACLAAASDRQTAAEVLDYMISPDNLRPKLLPALLENPSVPEGKIVTLALSASQETIAAMLKSARVRSLTSVLETLKTNPYLKKESGDEIEQILHGQEADPRTTAAREPQAESVDLTVNPISAPAEPSEAAPSEPAPLQEVKQQPSSNGEDDEAVAAYLNEHANEISAEGNKPFQAIGGVVDLFNVDYFADDSEVTPGAEPAEAPGSAEPSKAASPPPTAAAGQGKPVSRRAGVPTEDKRLNTLQKINALDVKGRIQVALKGNKEERSILIRDGTKVVALAVLEAPKLSDGEVEKFASQKNVLEAVLRQIPLKRRFMKNYIVVRNLVANPRTPIDLGLGLMKNLLAQDLKNLSQNKEVSDTIRKLALKMYKQKMETANKK